MIGSILGALPVYQTDPNTIPWPVSFLCDAGQDGLHSALFHAHILMKVEGISYIGLWKLLPVSQKPTGRFLWRAILTL